MNALTIAIGVATLIVLIATCVIYFRLLEVERQSNRLQLFDKRYRIYQKTSTMLMKLSQGPIEIYEIIDRKSSLFLFEKEDVYDFIEEIGMKSIDYRLLCQEIDSEIKRVNHGMPKWYEDDIWKEKCEKQTELSKWFRSQYENLELRFMKYLDFRKHFEQVHG